MKSKEVKHEIMGMSMFLMWYCEIILGCSSPFAGYAVFGLKMTGFGGIFMWILFIGFTVTFIMLPYLFLTDTALSGKFSYSENGITIYSGFLGRKAYFHKWEEFVEADVVYDKMSQKFFVYFSTSPLTPKEKEKFLSKTRRDLKRIAFFQFRYDVLNDILQMLPEEMGVKLYRRVENLHRSMNIMQKLEHLHLPK